jgi:hypothetical protein
MVSFSIFFEAVAKQQSCGIFVEKIWKINSKVQSTVIFLFLFYIYKFNCSLKQMRLNIRMSEVFRKMI